MTEFKAESVSFDESILLVSETIKLEEYPQAIAKEPLTSDRVEGMWRIPHMHGDGEILKDSL